MNPYNDKELKKKQVERMFDSIAPSYDRLNHLLSFNMDRMWRRRLVEMLAELHPQRVLDVAAGTGDLSVMMACKIADLSVTGVDLSEGMSELARQKALAAGLGARTEFKAGDAEKLPFAEDEFDAVTVAFGIRNFQNLDVSMREMYRVSTVGGTLFLLEFGEPQNKIFGGLYRCYSKTVLPLVGGLLSGDSKAYGYLTGSIREFSKVDVLDFMQKAGFRDCVAEKLTNGVAVIYKGIK